MRYRELFERVQTLPVFKDYTGQDVELTLIWNPSPDQTVNLLKRSSFKEMRVLLVGAQMVIWDGKYVEHRDVIDALVLPKDDYVGRDKKLFVGLRDDGSPWITRNAENSLNPKVQRLLKAGFNLGSGRYD